MKTNPGRAYKPDALFLGFQTSPYVEKPVALFNVIKKGHFLYHSTVTAKTLEENHLKVPDIKPKGPFHKPSKT